MSCYEILAGSCSCLHDGLMFEDVGSALKFNRVFRDLSAEEHQMIEQKFVHVQSPKHKLLFEPGEQPAHLHLMLSGQLKMVHYLADGRESMLQMICPGSLFSTSAVVMGSPYSSSAWTLGACSYAYMKREDLVHLMKEIPSLSIRLMELMAEFNEMLLRRIEYQTVYTPEQRLVKFLLGQSETRNSFRWRLPMPKGELARVLGTVPETLSRCFNDLIQQGVLQMKGRDITIQQPELLREICPE